MTSVPGAPDGAAPAATPEPEAAENGGGAHFRAPHRREANGARLRERFVVRAYGVGSLRKDDGTIDHTLVTFLVHRGRVLERYLPQPGAEESA